MRRFFPLLLSFLAACGSAPAAPTRLEYYLTADPPSLDPALSTDVQSGEMVAILYDNLVQFDVDAQLQPGLATRWEPDPGGRRYTFHLRSGATFHDGKPIGAKEVLASVLRALAPDSKGGRQWPLLPIKGARAYAAGEAKGVEGIAVPDDSTIVFTLEEPLNTFSPSSSRCRSPRWRRLRCRPASWSGRWGAGPGGSSPGRTTTRCCLPGTRSTGTARRRRTRCGCASSPRRSRRPPSTRRAFSACSRSRSARPGAGSRPIRTSFSAGPRFGICTSPSTPGADRCRMSGCAARSTWRWTSRRS